MKTRQSSWPPKAFLLVIFVTLSSFLVVHSNEQTNVLQQPAEAEEAVSVKKANPQRRRLQSFVINTDDLKNVKTRFYIYEDHGISRKLIVNIKKSLETPISSDSDFDHLKKDYEAERVTLQALEKHPLRTRDPNEASLYIIPTAISEMVAYGCRWEGCSEFDESFAALREHEIFKKTQGHNHVIISYGWFSFNKRFAAYVPALGRNYRVLENVTVASHMDPFGCLKLTEDTKSSTEKGFNHLFPVEVPVTKAFSIGLGVDAPFQIQKPTFSKFTNSEYFVFYHSRNATWDPFGYGSTPYRKAPLEMDMSDFPKSSIGLDIEKQDWIQHFLTSKFCLVIRGDTPHSHSFLYSVRAGCIPVIVSDYYQDYSGPFKSSIQMKDFCVFIKESDFIANPKEAILKLQDMSEEEIKTKLRNLDIAQSIVLPDHEESLFVEAFVKESMEANKKRVPQLENRVPVKMEERQTVVSGKTLTYRYPSTLVSTEGRKDDDPVIIVGVLSTASKIDPRITIRNTWAENYHGRVFFLVSGFWDKIEEEFYNYGDLLWIDMQEDYLLLTYKSMVFFHAVETLVDSYDYAFKTDDDSYVGMPEISRILKKHQPNYWGICNLDEKRLTVRRDTESYWYTPREMYAEDKYPVYAQGMGYALSREHLQCMLPKVAQAKFMPWEDAAVGILSVGCSKCQRNEFEFDEDGLTTVQHRVALRGPMIWIHWDQMKKQNFLEWVDKPPELKQMALAEGRKNPPKAPKITKSKKSSTE